MRLLHVELACAAFGNLLRKAIIDSLASTIKSALQHTVRVLAVTLIATAEENLVHAQRY